MTTPTAFLHCGLHKTGTSALQSVFSDGRRALRAAGVLYPEPGGGESAHHNLAWQVAGDRRFDPAGLTLARTLSQLADFRGDVVLSSEDFESVLHRPERLAPLLRALAETGRQVCLVVYARERASYARSLFAELLKHGYAASFAAFQREIDAEGRLSFRDWVFQFDDAPLLEALAALPCTRVVRRRYEASLSSGSGVGDCAALSRRDLGLGGADAWRWRNARQAPAESLALFCQTRLGRDLHPGEAAVVARLGVCVGQPERVFSPQTVHSIARLPALGGRAQRVEDGLVAWWDGRRRRPPALWHWPQGDRLRRGAARLLR